MVLDRGDVEALLSLPDCIDAVERAFCAHAQGRALPTALAHVDAPGAANGTPLAIMDSIAITRLRTGAATAVAAKYLARPDAQSVMICGAGTQTRVQLASLALVPDVKRAMIWSRHPDKAAAFASEMSDTALQDAAGAALVYERAVAQHRGARVKLN